MDGQLHCESHLPTSPVSGPVTPTTPVSPTGGDEKKKVSLLTFKRTWKYTSPGRKIFSWCISCKIFIAHIFFFFFLDLTKNKCQKYSCPACEFQKSEFQLENNIDASRLLLAVYALKSHQPAKNLNVQVL